MIAAANEPVVTLGLTEWGLWQYAHPAHPGAGAPRHADADVPKLLGARMWGTTRVTKNAEDVFKISFALRNSAFSLRRATSSASCSPTVVVPREVTIGVLRSIQFRSVAWLLSSRAPRTVHTVEQRVHRVVQQPVA